MAQNPDDPGSEIDIGAVTVDENGLVKLVFDFTNLEYISSAGLRQVIVAYKKMAQKDGFKIINVSDEVYDVFSLTGFDSKIDIQKK